MAKFKTISADWCDNFLENLNCAYDKDCGFNNMGPAFIQSVQSRDQGTNSLS